MLVDAHLSPQTRDFDITRNQTPDEEEISSGSGLDALEIDEAPAENDSGEPKPSIEIETPLIENDCAQKA